VIYWDTSCVLKLYAAESDSGLWQKLLLERGGVLVSSALLEAELGLALEHKEVRGELRKGGAAALREHVQRDVQAGRLRLIPVGADVLAEAVRIGVACLRARPPVLLRTLDGIHLATARLVRCAAVATADERMRSAARHLGLTLADPR